MVIDIRVSDSCSIEKGFCTECSSHFMKLRPLIKEAIASKHFLRDVKDEDEANSIIQSVLDCSHMDFTELHKFEESIDGISLFRAKMGNSHIVYCIKGERVMFLRRIRNFDEYRKFIDDKKEIKRIIESISH
jgi:hypothetical protein